MSAAQHAPQVLEQSRPCRRGLAGAPPTRPTRTSAASTGGSSRPSMLPLGYRGRQRPGSYAAPLPALSCERGARRAKGLAELRVDPDLRCPPMRPIRAEAKLIRRRLRPRPRPRQRPQPLLPSLAAPDVQVVPQRGTRLASQRSKAGAALRARESRAAKRLPELAAEDGRSDEAVEATDASAPPRRSRATPRVQSDVDVPRPHARLHAKPKVLLVASGAYNPMHMMHLRTLYLARSFLERQAGVEVVGGIISPGHTTLVRQKQRRTSGQILPPRHRLNMARLLVGSSRWLTVDAWEITRRRIMDYLSLLGHVRDAAARTWPGAKIRVVYLTKPYGMLKLSPRALRAAGHGCLCVCRPIESERLLRALAARVHGTSAEEAPGLPGLPDRSTAPDAASGVWDGIAHVVEDAAMLTAELERTTSAAVRADLMAGRCVDSMIGRASASYAARHRLGAKLAGEAKWTPEETSAEWCAEDGVKPYGTAPPAARRKGAGAFHVWRK